MSKLHMNDLVFTMRDGDCWNCGSYSVDLYRSKWDESLLPDEYCLNCLKPVDRRDAGPDDVSEHEAWLRVRAAADEAGRR